MGLLAQARLWDGCGLDIDFLQILVLSNVLDFF